MIAIMLAIGILIGLILSRITNHIRTIGNLRMIIDADGYEGKPYLFLELKSGIETLREGKLVILKVCGPEYVPRK